MTDFSHLHALEVRLSHERERLFKETTETGCRLRSVWINQIEKEISDEKAFLGLTEVHGLADAELLERLGV